MRKIVIEIRDCITSALLVCIMMRVAQLVEDGI